MSKIAEQETETTSSTSESQQQPMHTKKRRKDKLHQILDNEEIQFEVVPPAKEPKKKKLYYRRGGVKTKVLTSTSTTSQPEIETPTVEESSELHNLLQKKYENFLGQESTEIGMRRIAEEQMRINYLLAVYGMPDIDFNLWSDAGTLGFQLRERLKIRSVRKTPYSRDITP